MVARAHVVALTAAASIAGAFAGTWVYRPANGKKFGVRSAPAFDAARTHFFLEPGQLFEVASEFVDENGMRFLGVADMGWVFERDGKGNHFCMPANTPSGDDSPRDVESDDDSPRDVETPEDAGDADQENLTIVDLASTALGGLVADLPSGKPEVQASGTRSVKLEADKLEADGDDTVIHCDRLLDVEDTSHQVFDLYAIHPDPQLTVIPRLLSAVEIAAVVALVDAGVVVDGRTVAAVEGVTQRLSVIAGEPPSSAMITVSQLEAANRTDDTDELWEYAGSPRINFFVFLDDDSEAEGAELAFPHLALKVRPSSGCAVFWSTVGQDGRRENLLAHRNLLSVRGSMRSAVISFAV